MPLNYNTQAIRQDWAVKRGVLRQGIHEGGQMCWIRQTERKNQNKSKEERSSTNPSV